MPCRNIAFIFLLNIVSIAAFAQADAYKTETNLPYYSDSVTSKDSYARTRCMLDIYYPKREKNFSTVVWFHGGGLTGGEKFIPERLKNNGIAIVAVNYRLAPQVNSPVYIQDAAAAIAWVYKNIAKYGGDPSRIFISGHSAGGYLAAMVGLDKQWLKAHRIDANTLAGIAPFSCQAITHFTIRKESNIPDKQPVIDQYAPLYHVRADAPPLLLITGDREMEMLGRYEENAYLARMMKVAGHKQTTLYEMAGYGHDMTEPGYPLLLNFIRQINEAKHQKK
ncbi:MAG TPA: alpha/beta hydrolase [Ohtaekwangia sp.]|uniref:alpha/beta hydrolase n=1 Tax=Ohtaekwangia sp. TaxID=2066019 RepID=UPI002F92FD4D